MAEAAEAISENRPPAGRFRKGVSGNPGGRPKQAVRVQELARKHTKSAIDTLARCMASEDERVQVAASVALLDRAWGKPAQALTGADGQALSLSILIDLGRAAAQVQEKQLAGEQTLQIPEVTNGGSHGQDP